jgi:hypothetical protein
MSQLRPVGSLSQRFGWKGCIYGGPGMAKTPLLMTAPHAVHAFIESGLSSVNRVMDQPGVMLSTHAQMRDYVLWAVGSAEARQFQCKTFDSYTQMADVILDEEKKINKDPRKSYGNMAEKMMEMMHLLFFAPEMHVVGLCKETLLEIEGLGKKYRPLFPGQALDAGIPHLFDSFWRLENVSDGKGGMVRAIRTRENFNVFARERTNNMLELELPQPGHTIHNLTYLIQKAMQ